MRIAENMTSYHLLSFYEFLAKDLDRLSGGDAAALRCLKRKYDELQDDVHVTYTEARTQLIQEYVDCLPVDA